MYLISVLLGYYFIFSFQVDSPYFIDARTLIEKSIQYHDPQGKWEKEKFHFSLYEGRSNGNYRLTDIELNQSKQIFKLTQIRGKDRLYRYLAPDSCEVQWNYSLDIPTEIKEQYRLQCEGGNTFYKNYYSYLYGLPMKLRDPGTQITSVVKKKNFFGKELLEVKVTYIPEVGKDVWYFYFNPTSFSLSGYRFYHNETKNDGEYILLEDEITINGIKFPKKRAWYTHQASEYLGNDDLLNYPATRY